MAFLFKCGGEYGAEGVYVLPEYNSELPVEMSLMQIPLCKSISVDLLVPIGYLIYPHIPLFLAHQMTELNSLPYQSFCDPVVFYDGTFCEIEGYLKTSNKAINLEPSVFVVDI